MDARLIGFELAFPCDAHTRQQIRQIRLLTDLVGQHFFWISAEILDEVIVDVGFAAPDLLLTLDAIRRGETALLPIEIRQFQITRDESIRSRVAEARDRSGVPEHAVVAAGHDERHGDVHIVLCKLDVFAVVIQLRVLMLPEAVERFIGAGIEELMHSIQIPASDFHRLERAAIALSENGVATGIEKRHRTSDTRNTRSDLRGLQHDPLVGRFHREVDAACWLRDDCETFGQLEILGGHGGHAHDAIGDHLQTHSFGRTVRRDHEQAVRGLLEVVRLLRATKQRHRQREQGDRRAAQCSRQVHRSPGLVINKWRHGRAIAAEAR